MMGECEMRGWGSAKEMEREGGALLKNLKRKYCSPSHCHNNTTTHIQ